jgi:hypothetical protein
MRVGYLIRKGDARKTHPSMACSDGDNREHMRSVLGWVEGARKGHFPDIDSAQIKYRIATSFCWIHALELYLDAGHQNEPHYVLMIRMSASCSSSSLVRHPALTVLEVLCVLFSMWHWSFPVLRTITRTQRALSVWKSVPRCEGMLGKDVSRDIEK